MKKAVALALALVLILALLPGCGSRKLEASQRAQILLEAAAFSRSGLIDKLVSEGFTRRDAEKGVDSLDVDWFRVAAIYATEHWLDFFLATDEQAVARLQEAGFSHLEAVQGWALLLDTLNASSKG